MNLKPLLFALTDRDTGKAYIITSTKGYISLREATRRDLERVVTFAAKRGPLLAKNVRLLVRAGRLAYELVPDEPPVSLPPLLPYDTRAGTMFRLKLPEGFTGTEALAYEVYDV